MILKMHPSSVQPELYYGTEGNTPTAVEAIILDKIDEPLHKLCASALIFPDHYRD